MFRVLIVDDEMWLRKGIACSIDWESYGFTIAGEAANGKEALDRIAESSVHLVLVDLRMPEMDGLELMRTLNLHKTDIPLVTVITGMGDFEYAQQALRLGAFDYLLKPVVSEDLADSVIRAKEILQLNGYFEVEEPMTFNKESTSNTVEQVRSYILSHYEKQISLTHIADYVGMHPAYISSLFRQETGYTFINYITQIRLAKAKELLQTTVQPITAIAENVGYADAKHFYKLFKKWVGSTPLEYREMKKK